MFGLKKMGKKKNNKSQTSSFTIGIIIAVILIMLISMMLGHTLFLYEKPKNALVEKTETTLSESIFYITAKKRIFAEVIVYNTTDTKERYLGFTTDPWMNFGRMPYEAKATREININNNNNKTTRYIIKAYGAGIQDNIKITPNRFILDPEENISISIQYIGNEIGNFEGEVDVILQIPKYKLIEKMI